MNGQLPVGHVATVPATSLYSQLVSVHSADGMVKDRLR